MNKIFGGTPRHSDSSLCRSCRNASITRGTRLNEEMIICSEKPVPYDLIRMHVTECSKYDDARQPALFDMRQIAWALCTDRKGKQIGFVSPAELRERKDKIRVVGRDHQPWDD